MKNKGGKKQDPKKDLKVALVIGGQKVAEVRPVSADFLNKHNRGKRSQG